MRLSYVHDNLHGAIIINPCLKSLLFAPICQQADMISTL